MPLNLDALLTLSLPDVEQTISDRDSILYSLSLGLGTDPLDPFDLKYTSELASGFEPFPTMPVVIGHPGPWIADPRYRIDRKMLVHGSQRLRIHRPLPLDSRIIGSNRVVQVFDKGADRGAIIVVERSLIDGRNGELIAVSESTLFCRADGGFGGIAGPAYEFRPVPDGPPDLACQFAIPPGAALLYRLNGDRNPLHADPGFASQAGFERPIMHGLGTYGIAAQVLLRNLPESGVLQSFEARMSKPVLPGESLKLELWRQGGEIAFRVRAMDRDAVVLDRGLAGFR